jgi:hypothetical protein
MKKESKSIIILLIISFVLTLILSYTLKGSISLISKDYIEFLLGLSITLAGFGLVAFQIGKSSNELKKDFIESSILMILSSLLSIYYWIYPTTIILAIIAGFLFLWGMILLLVVLINERFDIVK